jgi:exopolysaccharide production protein ExoQ
MFKLPATLLCILLIFYLFRTYRSEHKDHSAAIWVPFVFMLFAGSRPISFWLNYWFGIGSYSASDLLEEGNSIERAYYFIIFILGLIALLKRKLDWNSIFKGNKIICLYFLFCLISISWSDYTFVAFKRLFKTLCPVVMVLIVLTEDRPYAAIGFIMKRVAFVVLPLSALLIQYYPIGKEYHVTGAQLFIGVTSSKNGLGMLCLIAGTYIAYALFIVRKDSNELGQKMNISTYAILLPMLIWLFYKANSATSLICMIVAVGIFLLAQRPFMKKHPDRIFTIFICGIILFGALQLAIDIKSTFITFLGRRPDLTSRVPMWYDLLSMVQNPLVGFGNESFWLGERIIYVQKNYGPLLQAHNGYLETYLNLGLFGLTLLVAWILSGFMKILSLIKKDYAGAIFRFSLIVVICLYNWTEATFYGKSNMWTLFLFCTIVVPAKGLNADMTTEKK